MIIYEKYKNIGDVHWKSYKGKDGHKTYKQLVDWLIGLFPDRGSVLDIGCGDGLFSWRLSEKGLNVVGFDSSEYGIKIARKKGIKNADFWVSEAELIAKYNLSNFQFDYALATEIIEHIWNAEAIKNIFDKYIKKFMILTTVDKENSKHSGSKYHYHEFRENELKDMFKDYKITRLANDYITGEFNTKENMVFKIEK